MGCLSVQCAATTIRRGQRVSEPSAELRHPGGGRAGQHSQSRALRGLSEENRAVHENAAAGQGRGEQDPARLPARDASSDLARA